MNEDYVEILERYQEDDDDPEIVWVEVEATITYRVATLGGNLTKKKADVRAWFYANAQEMIDSACCGQGEVKITKVHRAP